MTNEMTAKEAVKILRFEQEQVEHRLDGCSDTQENRNIYEAFRMAIKALEQRDVLEKIRAEILEEAEYAYADFDRYKEDILHAEPDELPDDDFRYGMERAVEIINKYRKGGV